MNSFKNSENMNDKEMGFWCGFLIENSSNDKKYAMILYLGTGLLSYYNSTSIYRITTIISDYRSPKVFAFIMCFVSFIIQRCYINIH